MDFLLPLTFLLTPAYVVKVSVFGFPSNVLMLWVIVVWVIFAAWLTATRHWRDYIASKLSLDKKYSILISLFLLAGVVSLFAHGITQAKLGQFIVLFLQPVSMFFIGRYLISKSLRARDLLLVTCYLLLSVAGLYAIIQYFTLIGLPPAWQGNSQEPKRALSFFIHPNFYALWAAPLLAFLIPDVAQKIKGLSISSESQLAQYQRDESRNLLKDRPLHSSSDAFGLGRGGKTNSFISIIAWVIGAIGLFLSLSRAGWLGLAAAAIVYLIMAADKKIRQLAFGVAVIVALIIIATPNLRYRFILPFLGEKSSVSRLSLWHTGLKGVKESPVTGLGLTGFSKQWKTLNTDPGLAADSHNFPHNIFLDLWVETGIIGLISLIGLIGLVIYRGLRSAALLPPDHVRGKLWRGEMSRVQPSDREVETMIIQLSVSLFLIALMIQGQIDNPYFKNDLAMVFWIVLSLAI